MAKKSNMEDLRRLISIGKEKGYLTYDEVNSVLPEELVSSEKIDDMMMIFDEMDIEIVDSSQDAKVLKEKIEEEAEPVDEADSGLRLEERILTERSLHKRVHDFIGYRVNKGIIRRRGNGSFHLVIPITKDDASYNFNQNPVRYSANELQSRLEVHDA